MVDSEQNKSHVYRVVKVRELVTQLECGNEVAREALKLHDWDVEAAKNHIKVMQSTSQKV